ncbi:ras GTPase-activating protein-binding protein 1-like [Hippopotamus amphibius kiboko]|uniref:ras GTPase-activating protein-binding protein 1-like n=1 Tax=Hippopotamus amphibius kiboko TaxID=575201 RepID=UPI002597819D|nr:ras GTPase-activating protein-binding protein 1-like [Hippopotamus amphibius kiboko]
MIISPRPPCVPGTVRSSLCVSLLPMRQARWFPSVFSGLEGPEVEGHGHRRPDPKGQVELTKAMVMEKRSPLLVGREFVRQYYTLLNQAPDMLHRFYGKNSSYVHGGLDSNGKPADAVYGQKEIHRKVMSQNVTNCHTKIRHVDAHATLNDGVVVQVMGLLSNNNQALRRFMQTFVLAPEGSVANKFYVHNDIFRY